MNILKKDELILKLQKGFGFTPSEAEAYYYLLSSDMTASQLSAILNINRSYTYGLLKKLIYLGFCVEIKGTVRKFRAVEPALAFKSTLDDLEQNLTNIKKLSTEIEPLYKTRIENSSDDSVKVLYSTAHILDTINKYENEAQEEIVAFSKPPFIMDASNLKRSGKVQQVNIKQGIVHKTIYEMEKGNELHIKKLRHFKDIGEEVRVVEFLPMKLLVFDSQKVVFTLIKNQAKKDDMTFTFLSDVNVAKTFRMIFQTYWDNAMTYDEFVNL